MLLSAAGLAKATIERSKGHRNRPGPSVPLKRVYTLWLTACLYHLETRPIFSKEERF